jgi:hypothetical protein
MLCVAVCCHVQGVDRRERLRRLAMETIDLAKDPYYMRNHLGQVSCGLQQCLAVMQLPWLSAAALHVFQLLVGFQLVRPHSRLP